MKIFIAILSFAAALLASTSVPAKEKYREVVNAETHDKFEQVVASVRKDMQAGGRYEFVRPDERTKIDDKLAEMEALFVASGGSVTQMRELDKIALFNAQEVVNAILTKRDSDRVICEKRAPIGSHIPKTKCHTYGQEEEARRGTVKVMHDWGNRGCVGGTPGRPCMPGSGGSGG